MIFENIGQYVYDIASMNDKFQQNLYSFLRFSSEHNFSCKWLARRYLLLTQQIRLLTVTVIEEAIILWTTKKLIYPILCLVRCVRATYKSFCVYRDQVWSTETHEQEMLLEQEKKQNQIPVYCLLSGK